MRARRCACSCKGDLHDHSDWSDGGHTIRAMAEKARDLGHEYFALTDHSPRLKVANGLSRERLLEQLDVVAELNEELAPFRILTGVEVDILDDGALDHADDMLERARLGRRERALEAAHGRPGDDAAHGERDLASAGRRARPLHRTAAHRSRPTRVRVRPRRGDRRAGRARHRARDQLADPNGSTRRRRCSAPRSRRGLRFTISTDAHATDQLEWQAYGTDRAAECGVQAEQVVNAMPADDLLAWSNSRS